MATRIIYICDRCKKESDSNNLTRFELRTDLRSNDMYRVNGTQILHVCDECSKELIKPFLEEEE